MFSAPRHGASAASGFEPIPIAQFTSACSLLSRRSELRPLTTRALDELPGLHRRASGRAIGNEQSETAQTLFEAFPAYLKDEWKSVPISPDMLTRQCSRYVQDSGERFDGPVGAAFLVKIAFAVNTIQNQFPSHIHRVRWNAGESEPRLTVESADQSTGWKLNIAALQPRRSGTEVHAEPGLSGVSFGFPRDGKSR